MRIAPILISAVIVHVHASLITIHDTEKLPSEKPTEEQQQQAQELYKKLMSVWHNIKIKVSPFANADNIAGTSDSHLLKNYWYRSYHTAHKELEVALDPHVARFAAFQQTHNPDTTMKQRFEYALGSLHEDIHGAACIQDFAGVENEISRSIAEIIVLRAAARSNASIEYKENESNTETSRQAVDRLPRPGIISPGVLVNANKRFTELAVGKTIDNCFRYALQMCIVKLHIILELLSILITRSPYVSNGREQLLRNHRLDVSMATTKEMALELKQKMIVYGRKHWIYGEHSSPSCHLILDTLEKHFKRLAEIAWNNLNADLIPILQAEDIESRHCIPQ